MLKQRKPRTATVTKEMLLKEVRKTEDITSLRFEVHKEEYGDFVLYEETTGNTITRGTRKELYHYLKAYNTIHNLNWCKNKNK